MAIVGIGILFLLLVVCIQSFRKIRLRGSSFSLKRPRSASGSFWQSTAHSTAVFSASRTGVQGEGDERFISLIAALRTYKEEHGDVQVPLAFTVPDRQPWPAEARGLKLGLHLQTLRVEERLFGHHPEDRRLLDDLGVAWRYEDEEEETGPQPLPLYLDKSLDVLAPHLHEWEHLDAFAGALLDLHYSRRVSQDEHVRKGAVYEGQMAPSELSMALTRRHTPEEVTEMRTQGYRHTEFELFNWAQVVEALLLYKALFGDVDVPRAFVLDDQFMDLHRVFPPQLRRMELGRYVQSLRNGDVDAYEDAPRRRLLDALGFDWRDTAQRYLCFRFVPFFQALLLYLRRHSSCMPPPRFVVPDDGLWPMWMEGMPLGEWTQLARYQMGTLTQFYPERYRALSDLGFHWGMPWSRDVVRRHTRVLGPLPDYFPFPPSVTN